MKILPLLTALTTTSVLFSCAVGNNTLNTVTAENSNDLYIVDCLLPAKVRKLGQIATYLAARQATKTSAVECEIRGGEYTAYDRASLSTALSIWSPKAQAGNAEAQNYVGEIYEKGLGVEPDYELANVWYKKAARQGYSKAQMNLGFLYEKGLGVEKNMATAMEWYGKSSSLADVKIPYATTLVSNQNTTQLSAELKLLKSSLKNSKAETKILKNKLHSMQNNLLDSQLKLSALQSDYSMTEEKVKVEKNANQNQQTIGLLSQQLKQKNQEINYQQSNVKTLESQYKNEINVLTDKLAETQKRAEQILFELKKKENHATQSQVTLLETEVKLAETEKNLLQVNKKSNQRLLELNNIRESLKSPTLSQEQKIKYEREKNTLIEKNASEVERLKNTLASQKQNYEEKIQRLQQSVKLEKSTDKPVIEIIDPPFVLTRGVPTVTLRSVVKEREIVGKVGSASGVMSLFINDQKKQTNKKGLFKSDVAIVGKETPIQIIAIDNNGNKASLDFVLSMKQAMHKSSVSLDTYTVKPEKNWETLSFGNYHALIIANNDYIKVPKLDTPEADGRAIDKILRSKYGFKTKLLLNGTRYQILSELNKLRSSLTEDDNLLIYYAGHGELDKVNMRGHWLPVDADGDNTANWISTVALTDILNSMSTKHIMVVSDSCYSGVMTRSSIARIDAGLSHKQRNDWLKAMIKKRSRTVLTSGGLKPVMDGGGGKHSVFANAFIKALSNNNQLLEGQALYRKVSSNIVAIAADYGIEQVPEYAPIRHAGHESGEFFFVPAK